VAVLSDEIAGGVWDNCADWKEGPNIPGRSRFEMLYKGEEIVKPLRKTMKKLAQVAHREKYCEDTRRDKLRSATNETHLLKIPIKTQFCFIDNLEPDENGCYPDWSRTCAGKHVQI
jgi:hypothetical protein